MILSCGFLSDAVARCSATIYEGIRLHYVVEDEPLGTAGPVRLALDEGLLAGAPVGDERRLLDRPRPDRRAGPARGDGRARRRSRSIAVEDTVPYGVVPTDDDGQVEAFLEKSDGPAPTNRINAGAYVIERVGGRRTIPAGRAVSFEREVFPALVGNGLLRLARRGLLDRHRHPRALPRGDLRPARRPRASRPCPPRDETDSLIGEAASPPAPASGPQTVLGAHCSVGSDSTVERSVLHDRVIVGADCVDRARACWPSGVRVGTARGSEPGAIVGAGARVEAGARVGAGARVEPAEIASDDRDRSLERRSSAIDAAGMLGDLLAQPHQIGDALWRTEAAELPPPRAARRPAGLRHGRLGDRRRPGRAAIGDRATRPLHVAARLRACRAGRPDTLVLCSATRATPRRRSPASTPPARPAPPRVVLTTGGSSPSARARTACR